MVFKTVGLQEITKEMRVYREKKESQILGYCSVKKLGREEGTCKRY